MRQVAAGGDDDLEGLAGAFAGIEARELLADATGLDPDDGVATRVVVVQVAAEHLEADHDFLQLLVMA